MTRKRKRFSCEKESISKKAKSEDEVIEISQSLNSSTIKEIENFFKKYLHVQLRDYRKFNDEIKKKIIKLENDDIKHKSKILDLENENASLRDEKEKMAQSSTNYKDSIKEHDDLKVKLENEKIVTRELIENNKRLQILLVQLRDHRKFNDEIEKKVIILENDEIKHKSKIIDLENENATLRDEKEKMAQSNNNYKDSNNYKDLIKERDDLKVKLENEKIEKGELTENIKRLQMKLQDQDRVKAIELKRAREKHVSRINELEEENLLLMKDFKAKESDYNSKTKQLIKEIEDTKNFLKEKDNKIISMDKESASFKEKYIKYKDNLRKAVADKITLTGKIQNSEIEKLSLVEKIEELTHENVQLYDKLKIERTLENTARKDKIEKEIEKNSKIYLNIAIN